jgi:hypothetical protein
MIPATLTRRRESRRCACASRGYRPSEQELVSSVEQDSDLQVRNEGFDLEQLGR